MTKTSNGSATAPANGRASETDIDEATMQAIEVAGSAKEYERFLPQAKALATPILHFRADGARALHNVTDGVAALLSRGGQLREDLPSLDLEEITALPDLAKGLLYTTSLINRLTGSTGEVRKLMDRATVLRSLLLTSADALAQSGILPMREVERIRTGRGPYDVATDCVDLATLFRENAAAVKDKTGVASDQVIETAEVGTRLQALLRPKGTPTAGIKPELKDAIDIRDRFWTLLVQGHRNLWRAGAWVFGPEVDDKVPALLAFTRSRSRKASEAITEADSQVAAAPQ